MPRIPLPLTGGFYVSRSLPISAQECKNLYVHINEGGGLSPESLFGTPGMTQLVTSGNEIYSNRGAHVMDGVPYFVNGGRLIRLDRTISGTGVETFAYADLGAISGSGRVSLADNGTQLCILVPGGTGYIWNQDTTTLATITDVDFTANGAPQHVVYIDGYFLFTTDTKKFIISALNDGLAYNALDFGSAEADPDAIVAPIVANNQLYICGGETIELFRNAGASTGAAFPFLRVEGGLVSIGVSSAFSLVNAAGTFFFIGGPTNGEPQAYAFGGGQAAPISNDGIDTILKTMTDTELGNVFGWTYTQNGTTFIGWTLPTRAIVYDTKSQRWHERQSFDVVDDVSNEFRWRVNSMVKAYGRILCGDSIDGRIGELDLDIYSEYGQSILRSVATMPLSKNGGALFVPEIELTCESGVGNNDDENPLVSMDRSLDGKTWTARRERRIGKKGHYKNRCIWRRNGRAARFEVFRFSMSGKIKVVFIKLEGNVR